MTEFNSGQDFNGKGSLNDNEEDLDDRADEENEVFIGIHTPDYRLRVLPPHTKTTADGRQYSLYCIILETKPTATAFRLRRTQTWRRFSEFVWLRKELDKVDNWKTPPVLPFKRFWNVLEPKFVDARRRQLEQWLYEVMQEPLYLSSSALHLFLQTELSIEDIQQYLEGTKPEEEVEEVWANHGRRHSYMPHNPLHNNFLHTEPQEIFCSMQHHPPNSSSESAPDSLEDAS